MDDTIILTELEAQVRTLPPFMGTPQFRRPDCVRPSDFRWIGRTIALLGLWDSAKAIPARVASQNLHAGPLFQANVSTIQVTLFEAIADLKLRTAHQPKPAKTAGGVFPVNAVHDFFAKLRDIINQAETDLFVVDPYLSDDIFNYLQTVSANVPIRLLTGTAEKWVTVLLAARTKYEQQHSRKIEVRQTANIHDRAVFLNRQTCYNSGASFKDGAQKAPTDLTPFPLDIMPAKIAAYEAIWQAATPI